MSNTFGIDLGTCNVKVFCKATGKVLNEKKYYRDCEQKSDVCIWRSGICHV